MHPAECPEWEYEGFPNKTAILQHKAAEIFRRLRASPADNQVFISDTRSLHKQLFESLTPASCPYFAGNYRGSDFRCLKYLRVGIRANPRVGVLPHAVLDQMTRLRQETEAAINGLDAGHHLPNSQLDSTQKLAYTVVIVCRLFADFLAVHPYANGNGHAARFFLVGILGRYGYWANGWQVEPRPPDPPYSALIKDYQDGNKEPLERHVLDCIRSR